jgi:hypothetical protein
LVALVGAADFAKAHKHSPADGGKARPHWITVGGRKFVTHHPNCGGWRWFLRETAPNARGDAHRGRHCLHGLSS